MESRLEISKTINNTLEKRITSLEKQYWRNEQYSRRECVEIVRIPDSTNEIKVCKLIGKVTDINVNQDCLESSHPLPSSKKIKIILKFSKRKDTESVLRNKNKNKRFNPRSIDIDRKKVFINESLCCYTARFFGVILKSCELKSGSKPFG